MVVPACIYLLIAGDSDGARGWGVPMATDIAFALGVLALLGRRIPMELRVFLLGLAVVDDLGAILVIAVAYTESIEFVHLGIAVRLIVVLVFVNRIGFDHAVITVGLSFLVWLFVFKSGVHATIAGVLVAAVTPAQPKYSREAFAQESQKMIAEYQKAMIDGDHERAESLLGEMEEISQGTESPMERLERLTHPWASYLILPAFAFANAGINFNAGRFSEVPVGEVTSGIIVGLVIGKVVGITLFPWLLSRIGLLSLPESISWSHVIGVGLVGGIGFTVSLFVSGLAFDNQELIERAKLGILCASVLAGLLGYCFLRFVAHEPANPRARGQEVRCQGAGLQTPNRGSL